MKKLIQMTIATVLTMAFLTACHEGPAEKKGRKIDNAVEKVQDKIENKGPAQKAGERVDELTDSSNS
ncbi:MAG: hypothetical protein H2069_09075 [Legionella sp.]|nr:hypothetical protein [Legionella sp.]